MPEDMPDNEDEHPQKMIGGVTQTQLEPNAEATCFDNLVRPVLTSDDLLKTVPLEVYLRFEEDVAGAYRDFYKDQIVNDKRNELGRFLFGVSFATIGLIVGILKLATPQNEVPNDNFFWLVVSVAVLLCSALCSLRLAVPKNQIVDPTRLELVELHHSNSMELVRYSLAWFVFWVIGLILGLVVLFV